METKEEKLAKWINDAMYRKRMGVRKTAARARISHATVSAISLGKPVNASAEVLASIAKALDTPIEPVLRMIGILPPVSEADELDAEILNVFNKMKPSMKEMYKKIGQGMVDSEQPKKNILQPERIS